MPLDLTEQPKDYDAVLHAFEVVLAVSRAAYDGVICNEVRVTMEERDGATASCRSPTSRRSPRASYARTAPPPGTHSTSKSRSKGLELVPDGPRSSYRSYEEQQELYEDYLNGTGNLAAVPGTSNHGWGTAVDVDTEQMRSMIDKIGAKYGYSK